MRSPSWLHSTPRDTPSWSLFLLNFHACGFALVGIKIIIIIIIFVYYIVDKQLQSTITMTTNKTALITNRTESKSTTKHNKNIT